MARLCLVVGLSKGSQKESHHVGGSSKKAHPNIGRGPIGGKRLFSAILKGCTRGD